MDVTIGDVTVDGPTPQTRREIVKGQPKLRNGVASLCMTILWWVNYCSWLIILEVIALITSRVVYVPPMSGVRIFFTETASTMAFRRTADFS